MLSLHGWALGNTAYKRAARRLTDRGCRVYAPAMPGFGRTAGLPGDAMSIAGYAAWVDAFLETVDVDEPALVIGHSFGGGVAIKLAHDFPERVRHLVLLNSVVGHARVEADGADVGRSLVRVTARDQVGPLWAICRWFADHGIGIEAVHASTEHGIAHDTFVVVGRVDAGALAAHLSSGSDGGPRFRLPTGWCPFHR